MVVGQAPPIRGILHDVFWPASGLGRFLYESHQSGGYCFIISTVTRMKDPTSKVLDLDECVKAVKTILWVADSVLIYW